MAGRWKEEATQLASVHEATAKRLYEQVLISLEHVVSTHHLSLAEHWPIL